MAINGNWTSSVVPKTENLYKLEVYIAQSDSMLPICTILSSRAHILRRYKLDEGKYTAEVDKRFSSLKIEIGLHFDGKGDLAFKLFE